MKKPILLLFATTLMFSLCNCVSDREYQDIEKHDSNIEQTNSFSSEKQDTKIEDEKQDIQDSEYDDDLMISSYTGAAIVYGENYDGKGSEAEIMARIVYLKENCQFQYKSPEYPHTIYQDYTFETFENLAKLINKNKLKKYDNSSISDTGAITYNYEPTDFVLAKTSYMDGLNDNSTVRYDIPENFNEIQAYFMMMIDETIANNSID